MSGPSREVTIKFNADFSGSRKEMASYAKDVKKFNDDIWKLEKNRVVETDRITSQRVKDSEKSSEKSIRTAKKANAEILNDAKKLNKDLGSLFDDMDRAHTRAIRDMVKESKQANAEILRDQKNIDKELVKSKAAQRRYEGIERRKFAQELKVDRFAEGAVRQFANVGKNALMLSGMDEKDTEKMLRHLIKIQLTYETILGAKEGVELLQRAWRAYAYSVKLAAEAHTALAIAETASAAAGGAAGGGVARGAASGLGGAAAAGAVGGLGSKILGGAKWAGQMGLRGAGYVGGAVASTPVALAGGVLAYADLARTVYQNRSGGFGLDSFDASRNSAWTPTGAGNRIGTWAGGFLPAGNEKRLGGMERSRSIEGERVGRMQELAELRASARSREEAISTQARMERVNLRIANANTDPDSGGNIHAQSLAASKAMNEEAKVLADKTRERIALQGQLNVSEKQMATAIEEEKAACERVNDLRRTEVDLLKQSYEKERAISEQKEQAHRSDMDRAFARGQEARNARLSLGERVLNMEPLEQNELLNVKKKLLGGGTLSRQEEELYRKSGIDEIKSVRSAHEDNISKKMKGTVAEEITREFGNDFLNAKKDFMDAMKNSQIQHKVTQELTITVKTASKDLEEVITRIEGRLKTLAKEVSEQELKNFRSKYDKDPTTPIGKDQAFQFNGRMAAVAGQV
jgi:hypothetical protein